jgi:hypothetical protein
MTECELVHPDVPDVTHKTIDAFLIAKLKNNAQSPAALLARRDHKRSVTTRRFFVSAT